MEPTPTTDASPTWPPTVSTFAELASFLNGVGTETFATSSYRCHFFPPRYGSHAQDESAYTSDDEREPYQFMLFGRVRNPELTDDQPLHEPRHTFFLEGGHDLPNDLRKLFAEQTEVLMEPVIQDDVLRRDEIVEVCTDADRITGKGGSFIEVFYSDSTLHVAQDGHPQVYADWRNNHPLTVGDWVLLEGTYHRQENFLSGGPIEYFIQARHVRLLEFAPPAFPLPPTFTVVAAEAAASTPPRNASADVQDGASGSVTHDGPTAEVTQIVSTETTATQATPKGRKRSMRADEADTGLRRSPRKKVKEDRAQREALGDITPVKHKRGKRAGVR
ncbi:hypothetical protein DFH06DRAFT_1147295 [Mycena polygramma]|nr:hypothetical protein DFH06DRAFT_1147295 [Mycena polygramma]